MKHTMRRQVTAVFTIFVSVLLFLSLIISTLFLGEYYIKNKQSKLIDTYKTLDKAASNDTLMENKTIELLNQKVEVSNLSFVIIPENSDEQGLFAAPNEKKRKELLMQLSGYLMGLNQQNGELLVQTDSYEIHKAEDAVNADEYLEMWGTLSDGSSFILRSPLESINQNVLLSIRFFTYIMLILLLVASVVVWVISRRLTDPILELAQISSCMADLDFEAKYTSGGDNEIGILGENFNRMSRRLESAISELKNANYELQQDIAQKEKTEQMRTEFVGNVSHELKTPIALIQGYAEGLKDGIIEDAQSREFYCDVIIDEANKMNLLVKNLLTLNQMELGKEEISYSRFDVVELIEGIVESSDIVIRQKEITVQIQATRPMYVWADEFKVEQVIRNYFSNAINHACDEKIIDIRAEHRENGRCRISVFNTGKQIADEDIDRIWDKFYKIDKAHTREYGGNGIGLSIVKAIMEAFRCDYGVNNYQNGVVFWFELEEE